MSQSITPSSGEIGRPAQRVLPSTPTDQPTESVHPVIPAPSEPARGPAPAPPSAESTVPGPTLHGIGAQETLAHGPGAPQVTHQPGGRDVVVDEAVEEPVTETPHINDWRPLTPSAEPLPDLVSTLAAVPGGLGTELDDGFVFADQKWTSDDGRWDATPIGAQLAMEQSGLGYLDDGYSNARHAAD
jgi:hypothetical protein